MFTYSGVVEHEGKLVVSHGHDITGAYPSYNNRIAAPWKFKFGIRQCGQWLLAYVNDDEKVFASFDEAERILLARLRNGGNQPGDRLVVDHVYLYANAGSYNG